MGARGDAFDHDVIEEHNVGNQMLPAEVGALKATAMQQLLDMMVPGHGWRLFPHKFSDQATREITIVTVDTMATRKALFERVYQGTSTRWWIDGRMGSQTLRVFTVDLDSPESVEWYRDTLYSDGDAVQEPCTARGIIYTSLFAAGHIANAVKRIANRQEQPREVIHMIEFDTIIKQK